MKFIKYIGFVFLTIGVILSLSQCKSTKTNNKTFDFAERKDVDTISIKNDSLDYEIRILEVGFYSWLQTQKPRGYHNQNYLENRNRRYVITYNIRATNPSRYGAKLYPRRINYNSNIDYGYEVNYLLYHFFKFFEQKYNQNLR